MIIGIDFDNTIINYENIFYKIALEKKLIPYHISKEKNSVRDFLRKKNIEDEWTIIQGEVYGSRILEASIYPNFFKTLQTLNKNNIKVFIVSHKTKYPYLGEKVNLHKSAMKWMVKNEFFNEEGLNFSEKNIFFELTKEKKVQRLLSLKCEYFIDDLEDILKMIPKSVTKVLFNPKEKNISLKTDNHILNDWNLLPSILSL